MSDAGPAFGRMPLHLLSMVLSQLDNFESLASAIFSHSSLYAAFVEDRDRIGRTIICNQISPQIMTDYAFPTYLSSLAEFGHLDIDRVDQFLFDHFYTDCPRPRDPVLATLTDPEERGPIDFCVASTLSRMHAIIQDLTRDLLQDTLPLAREHLGLRRRDYTNASDHEISRIHRAMYRYQIYCNLFRHEGSSSQRRHLRPLLHIEFFDTFSPWVNEQLACIHDYLERLLSRTFDEVAAHDIEWGYEGVNWVSVGKWNQHKQGFLFHGLKLLHRLHRAETYSERRDILRTVGKPLPRTWFMLGQTFSNGSTIADIDEWRWFWDHIDDTDTYQSRYATHTEPQFYYYVDRRWRCSPESDGYKSGPFRMWRQAHNDCWREDVIYHDKHDWLRRCGYVLWDAPELPISDQELQRCIDEARRQSLLNYFRRNDGVVRAKMRRSRAERAAIYQRGGRGYWSEGDLSRVVWTAQTGQPSPSGQSSQDG